MGHALFFGAGLDIASSGMPDSKIHHSLTRTRSSTLQERTGGHTNGSTSVRSEGHSIGLHHPKQHSPEKEDVSDNDYFDELESPNPYSSDMIGSGDADLGPSIATPRFPSSDSPAERVFGEERPDDGKMRDRLHDRADEADTFDDLFGNTSRTPPTESDSIKIGGNDTRVSGGFW